ncbi:hypothetical protein [Paenibacillus massiliensis]|uniref:hypothetical protein n=1 Tax=Paenibacillus massiliensis TaxID=225917 RepID=UPI00046FE640|nr:hypothetical protein [Paenibacillus massiliensis]
MDRKKKIYDFQHFLDSLQTVLLNLSLSYKEVKYPVNFCNHSSVLTYWFLLGEDKKFFSEYCIRAIKVFENDFSGYTKHWLIVHKEDGRIGKLNRPVIDMTIHQFGKELKPGVINKYPLPYEMIIDKNNHTRTLINIVRHLQAGDQKLKPRDYYSSILNFYEQLNSNCSYFSKKY